MSLSAPHRSTPVSGEITKMVKLHYKPPPTKPYSTQRIWCRTDQQLSSERPDDLWHHHFVRRRENLYRGFNSVIWEPYSPVGGAIILDPYELVLKTLSSQLDKKVWNYHQAVGRHEKLPTNDITAGQDLDKSSSSTVALDQDHYPTAGYKHIREHVNESVQRIKAVKAGQPYEEHVRQIQNIHRLEEEEKSKPDTDMVRKSVSNLSYLTPVHNVSDGDAEETDLEEQISISPFSRYSSPLFSRFASSRTVASGEATPAPDGSDKRLYRISSGISEKRDRQKKNHLHFLESIHILLTSLSNIKTKDLRLKVPLSPDVLMALRKEEHSATAYNMDRESRNRQSRQLRGMSTESMQPPDTPPASSQWDRTSVFINSYRRLTNVDPQPPPSRIRERRKSRVGDLHDRHRLETWEDLLAVDEKSFTAAESPSHGFDVSAGIISKAIRWQKRASVLGSHKVDRNSAASPLDGVKEARDEPSKEGRDSVKPPSVISGVPSLPPVIRDHPPHRKIPIWQLVAQEKSTKVFSDRQRNKVPDASTVVQKCRRDFNKLKKSVEQENDSELQKLQREKMALFKVKFNLFENMSPIFEENKFCMKMAAASMNRNAEALDVQPARWFEELREKTSNVCCVFDVSVMEILNKISKFSLMDSKTVLYAKAKLCLIVMSLPVYEICQIWMQLAIKYVLEVILLGDNQQFVEWLESRKLPYIICKVSSYKASC